MCRARRLGAALVTLAVIAPPAGAQPVVTPPVVIDGPSPAIHTLGGMSTARDGTGAVTYLKDVAGVPHVFVSRIVGGSFQPPEQVDSAAGLSGPSSQPVVAAGNGGVVLVAFINAGELYVVDRAGASSPWAPPQGIYANATNPAIQMSNFGKAYLAFSAAGDGGNDVLVAFYSAGTWALASSAFNVTLGDDAGTGPGAPSVAAAGDGVGIVAWGEQGHVYVRRLWGTSTSIATEQADVPSVSGWNEVGATSPQVSAGGDSSYADVVFEEQLSNGTLQQSRVLMHRLHGSMMDMLTPVDGLSTPGPEGADEPGVALNEYGRGFDTSARDTTNQVWAAPVASNGNPGATARVDSLVNNGSPFEVPGTAGLVSTLIAWQQTSAGPASAEIRTRYAQDGVTLGPEMVVSSPSMGPTSAANGLDVGGDGEGDALIAWVQGLPAQRQIVAARLFASPGQSAPSVRFAYTRSARPVLSWSAAREQWGQVTYTVAVDGVALAPTSSTSLTVPSALIDGPHNWQVTASNAAGQQNPGPQSTVWVDTTAPRFRMRLSGPPRLANVVAVRISSADAAAVAAGARASGIAAVQVAWGDRTISKSRHAKHIYLRPGLFRIKVTVTDKAGNITRLARFVRVLP